MMLSNTLQTLIERAERKGRAVKRVRELSVMGNAHPFLDREDVKQSPMIEQWAVTVQYAKQDGNQYKNIIVDHYGTEIAHIIENVTKGERELYNYYGESNSDRDALNGLCSYYDLGVGFRYRPSIDEFSMVV